MIDKQDVEDKKQLGLFGVQKGREMINPALVDSVLSGPRAVSPKQKHKSSENYQGVDLQTETAETSVFNPKVIHIDRSCLQCSGNGSQILRQLKLACLSYTQSPIPYQDKMYKVSDLLRVKAQVIANC